MSQDPWGDDLGDSPTQPIDLTEGKLRNKYSPEKSTAGRYRNICVTYNFEAGDSPDDDCVKEVVRRFTAFGEFACRYACFQLEIVSRLHLQAYFQLSTQMRLSSIKLALGERAHVEKAKAGKEKNKKYCSKKEGSVKGSFVELGTLKSQGRRADLEEIKDLLDGGVSSNDIRHTHFPQWMQYNRSFQLYQNLEERSRPRTWKTKTICLWGPTGTGKSLKAREMTSGAPTATIHLKKGAAILVDALSALSVCANVLTVRKEFYILLCSVVLDAEWWDAYHGEDNVIIDDFAPDQLEAARFKNLFDRYPMDVPVKGGFRRWAPKLVVITTNVDPGTWYQDVFGEADPACQRRLDEVHHMTDPYVWEEEKKEQEIRLLELDSQDIAALQLN